MATISTQNNNLSRPSLNRATKAGANQAASRTSPALASCCDGDQVRFGGGTKKTQQDSPAEEAKQVKTITITETTRTVGAPETDKTPPRPTLGTAAKNVFKAAFAPWELAKDVGIGALLAVATAIIPPHAHALAMIPFSLIIGTGIRTFSAVKQTYWPSKG
jgi:hypothetical protein